MQCVYTGYIDNWILSSLYYYVLLVSYCEILCHNMLYACHDYCSIPIPYLYHNHVPVTYVNMCICTYIHMYEHRHAYVFYLDFIVPSGLMVNIIKNPESLSIDIQWNAVNDYLFTSYTIFWGDDVDQFATADEPETSYTITGLTLDTVYTIRVTAANMCGSGSPSRTSVSFPAGTIIIYHVYVLKFKIFN